MDRDTRKRQRASMLVAGVAVIGLAVAAAPAPAREASVGDRAVAHSRLLAVAFARCAVSMNPRAVADFLADPVGTDNAAKRAKALSAACFTADPIALDPGALQFSNILLRGMLYEALVARHFKRKAAPAAVADAPPQSYRVAGTDPPGTTERRDYRALMRIGDCAVRAAPEQVRALLATRVASADEERALLAFRARWTGCLPGKGDQRFSPDMTRATVAEPFYRLARATADPQAEPTD